jgi:hypothetical protein
MRPLAYLSITTVLAAAGCNPAPAASAAEPHAAVARPLRLDLDALAATAAAGKAPATARYGGWLEANDPPAGFTIPVASARCVSVLAVAGPGLERASLDLYDARDKRLATAELAGGRIEAAGCGGAGRFRAELTVKQGAGEVALRAFLGDAAPEPAAGEVARPDAPKRETDPLALAIAREAGKSAPGARRKSPILRGAAGDEHTDWNLHLAARQCYTFVGVGQTGVKELGLYLWDPAGAKIAWQRAPGAVAILQHCPKASGPYRLRGQLNGGKGDYGVGVYAK